jgi:asparagine synthase (glutamine-hydrolysing)
LPSDFLVHSGIGLGNSSAHYLKRVLKLLCAKYFGADFAFRPKMGFALPLAGLFSHPRGRERMEDYVLPAIRRRGLIEPRAVEELWSRRASAGPRDFEALWTVLSFESWAEHYLDRTRAPAKRATSRGLPRGMTG